MSNPVAGAVMALVAGLTLFHAYLFGAQMASGELADPAVALRWLIAGGVARLTSVAGPVVPATELEATCCSSG
jgi:hypothetical protein